MIASIENMPVLELLGVPVQAITMEQALDAAHEAIVNRDPLQIGVVNAAKLVNMRRNETLRRDVLSSDLILADGAGVVWASGLLGNPVPERVAGIDLMMGLLRRGDKHGYSVYCLGATDEVSERVAERIAADYPNVRLVGRRNGYFSEEEEEEVAGEIAALKPDILFIGITSPKKEKFLARWSKKINASVLHGVGGSFDVMAGKVRRAPIAWQRCGLEWLYRVKQEPRRLWRRYLVTNTLFCGMVLKELLSQRVGFLGSSPRSR